MKKSVKRIVAVCLAVLMAGAVFAACAKQPENKVYKIGIIQQMKHEALDLATQGFIDAVYEKIGKENVDIDPQVGTEDSSSCATIANQLVSKGVDLIMANATNAMKAAVQATTEIPIVSTSITTYAGPLGLDSLNNGKTGLNVTGTSDLAPLDQQAAMIKEICPDTKTVGIIYCSSEENSQYQVDEVTKYLKDLGITATPYAFTETNDLQAIVQKAVADNDALYIPTDNTAANNTGIIDAVARPAKKPVFAGESGICKGCGIVTLSISYYDIGYKTGEMAAEILLDGKNPADMEIQYAPKFTKMYNKEIADELGITIPADYEAIAAE